MTRLFVGSVMFLLGAVARLPAKEPSPSPAPQSVAATFVPWLLQEKEELHQLPLSEVILYATGRKMIALDSQDETDQRVLQQLGTVLDEVIKRINAPDNPIQSVARINEVSSSFENLIRELLNASPGLACDFPKTAEGRVQRSGYPDLRLVESASKRIYYLDPERMLPRSAHPRGGVPGPLVRDARPTPGDRRASWRCRHRRGCGPAQTR